MSPEASGSAVCDVPYLCMQRSATQGEQLDAPDSWSASLACGPESTRHTTLFLRYILLLDVWDLQSYFILCNFFFSQFCLAAIFIVFLWAESFLSQWTFFWGGVHLIPWECSRGLSHLELSGHLCAKLEFSSISLLALLPLWAHSYWLLRAQMGAGEGELLNAKDIWPPPHSIPLSTSLLFLSPAHKCYTRMQHTHMQCHTNEWIAWR